MHNQLSLSNKNIQNRKLHSCIFSLGVTHLNMKTYRNRSRTRRQRNFPVKRAFQTSFSATGTNVCAKSGTERAQNPRGKARTTNMATAEKSHTNTAETGTTADHGVHKRGLKPIRVQERTLVGCACARRWRLVHSRDESSYAMRLRMATHTQLVQRPAPDWVIERRRTCARQPPPHHFARYAYESSVYAIYTFMFVCFKVHFLLNNHIASALCSYWNGIETESDLSPCSFSVMRPFLKMWYAIFVVVCLGIRSHVSVL